MSLRNRVLNLLDQSAMDEQPQGSLRGGKLTEWQKCVKKHGVMEASKYYNKKTKKCTMKAQPKRKAPKKKVATKRKVGGSFLGDISPLFKMLGLGMDDIELVHEGGKLGIAEFFKKLASGVPLPYLLLQLRQGSGAYAGAMAGAYAGGAKKGVKRSVKRCPRGTRKQCVKKSVGKGMDEDEKVEMVVDHLMGQGMDEDEALEEIGSAMENYGGNWFDSFKKGFMLPFEAISKLAPLAPLLL